MQRQKLPRRHCWSVSTKRFNINDRSCSHAASGAATDLIKIQRALINAMNYFQLIDECKLRADVSNMT